jgi:hypothetical protein
MDHLSRHLVAWAALLLLGTTSLPAHAAPESGPPPPPGMPGASAIASGGYGAPALPPGMQGDKPQPGLSGTVGGSVMFERLNEDYFATLDLYNNLAYGPLSFGIWVPLRFRVIDMDPQNDSVFRKEDWDEVSDFLRILRFVEVNLGAETWRFRGRFGTLEGESIGHGTVIAGYYNWLSRDHYQAGIVLDAAIKYGGVQFLLDNVVGPDVVGVRVFVRPTSFFTDNQWANRLAVGLSYAGDVRAPVQLRASSADPTRPAVDDKGRLIVDDDPNNPGKEYRTHVGVVGVDLEYAVLQTKLLDLVPYMDLNFMTTSYVDGSPAGLHLGTFFNIRLPTPVGPTLLTRLEYRAVGSGYMPRYFDTLYKVQRWQYDPGSATDSRGIPQTKHQYLQTKQANQTGPHGWLGELFFDFGGWVLVGGTYEDYEGEGNAALTLSLSLPKLQVVQAGALFVRRGFDAAGANFWDGAWLRAWLRLGVYGPLYVTWAFDRSWYVQPDGSFTPQDDFNVGVGVAFNY